LKRKYQVIIIGAGPAGSTLAYHLAIAGNSVLILDKAVFPRYKCCAGGLTVKAAKLLNINIEGLADDIISGAVVSFMGKHPYYGHSSDRIMYTVMRENFDHVLLKRAQEAGADVLQGAEAMATCITNTGVEVSTSVGEFNSEFIVGADGVRSRVAQEIGLANYKAHIAGIEAEVKVGSKDFARWKSQIGIDIGRIRGGYGWVFPKTSHLSVGIGCLADRARGLKHIFDEYLDSLRFEQYTIMKRSGGLLPVCIGEPIVARGRAILLGDAAGLADPLTGEGLYNAILSAQLAAVSIEKALACGKATLDDYDDAIASTIAPQMKVAATFLKVLLHLPTELFKVLNKDQRVWRACCKMLRGEMDYLSLKNKVFSLGRLYDLISHI
jgi:geranylgeranyl reductase family protein